MLGRIAGPLGVVAVSLLAGMACGACGGDAATVTVEYFEPTISWGETPLATELAWRFTGVESAASCYFDFDGDGATD